MTDNRQLDRKESAQPQEMEEGPIVAPLVDIFESKDEYLVVADVPGVEEDAIDIHLDRGELVLTARRRLSDVFGTQEFDNVDFRRAFRIPQTIDPAKVEAKLDRGVLTVHLPKSDSIKPRRIAVKAG